MAPLFTGLRLSFGRSAAEVAVSFFITSGGTVTTPGNGYIYHTFISPGSSTFTVGTVFPGSTVECLIVAGGGGGAASVGGGGGGGGVLNQTSITVTPGPYSITVGDGALANAQPNGADPGSNSSALGYTAYGGGGGGGYGQTGDSSSGSGGGGGTSEGTGYSGGAGNSPPTSPPQGNPGGSGSSFYAPSRGYHGGGGGGAGGPGNNSTPGPAPGAGGPGGNGAPYPAYSSPIIAPSIPTASPTSPNPPGNSLRTDFTSAVGPTGLYGGGGGGLNDTEPGSGQPTGGPGGGGAGGINGTPGTPGRPGIHFTGGGGGGSRDTSNGAGGTGIVIIRYLA